MWGLHFPVYQPAMIEVCLPRDLQVCGSSDDLQQRSSVTKGANFCGHKDVARKTHGR